VVGLTILSLVVWQGLAFAGGLLAATQYRSARELAHVNAELLATQALLAESSRMAERLHISRELHDSLGHHLAALSLNLELARVNASGRASEPLEDAASVAKMLLAEVRETVSTLRTQQALDLGRALQTLAGGVSHPRVHLLLPEDVAEETPARAHAVFRCVQEALTNAMRHSGARNVWIDVTRDTGRLEVRVRDDGRGASSLRPSNGLSGMRERFEEQGGSIEIDSEAGQGFRLRAWLPRLVERV
jgi:signal transduction histidine kinase